MAEVDNNQELNKTSSELKNIYHKNNNTSSNVNYILQKEQHVGLNRISSNDILVNNKISFKAHLHKCEKLFDNGASEVIIHGLGAAVYTASNLALRLKQIHYDTLDLDIKTSTVMLSDRLEALTNDAEDKISNRNNSAIHIRVFRKIPLGIFKCAK